MPVQFNAANLRQLSKLALRSLRLHIHSDKQDAMMDLDACHSNGCPLDFDKLEAFDDFNFTHDVAGIARHLDRRTGKLEDHFLPRCALPQLEWQRAEEQRQRVIDKETR